MLRIFFIVDYHFLVTYRRATWVNINKSGDTGARSARRTARYFFRKSKDRDWKINRGREQELPFNPM